MSMSVKKSIKNQSVQITEIFERISDGFAALDRNWCFTYLNQKAGEILKRDPENLIGKNMWTEFPESVNSAFQKSCEKALAEQQYTYLEMYYPPLDVWYEDHIYPSPDGVTIYFRDISGRKKNEKKVKELQAKMDAVMSIGKIGFWEWDIERDEFLWSDRMFEIHGLDKKNKIRYDTMLSYVHPDDKHYFFELKDRQIKSKENVSVEYRVILRDGTVKTLSASMEAITDELGKAIKFMGILQDISKNLKSKIALEKSLQRNTAFLKAIPDLIFAINRDGVFIDYHNPVDKKTFIAPGKFVGKKMNEVLPPELAEESLKNVQMVLTTGMAPIHQYQLEHPEGKLFFEARYATINESEALVIVRDITKRKITEEKLKQSEEKYYSFFDQSADAIFIFDENGQFQNVNTVSVNLLGYSVSEFRNMFLQDLLSDSNVSKNPIRFDLLDAGNPVIRQRVFKRKDGTRLDVEIHSKKLVDGTFLGVVRDITMRKKAEEEIICANEKLHQLTDHLLTIREEERSKIGREIHDELGQYLTVLKISVSRLDTGKTELKNHTKEINEILKQLDNCLNIVRKISYELRPGILDDLGIIDALDWHAIEFEKRTEIKTVFISDVEELNLSEEQAIGLFRIFQESLTNVARHAKAKMVKGELKVKDNFIVLSIKDDGVGFDINAIANNKSLGLLGIKERTVMMKGDCIINSSPGKGTTVKVSIPLN